MHVHESKFQQIFIEFSTVENSIFGPAIFIWFISDQFFFKFYKNGDFEKLNDSSFKLIKY